MRAEETLVRDEENPLRAGLPRPRAPQPCVMVIFGATGDLTRRKLMPALFDMAEEGLLPAPLAPAPLVP